MKRFRTYLNTLLTGAILLSALAQPIYAQGDIQIVDAGIDAAIDLPASDLPLADSADGAAGNWGVSDMAMAAGVLPSNVFDANDVGWTSVRGLSSSEFGDHFDAMKDENMMLDIEINEIDGKQEVSAVWQRNIDDRGWAEHRNLNSDEFGTKWTEYKNKGYRLIDQEAYTLGGTWNYAGIWVENKENLGWASFRNLTSDEFGTKYSDFRNDGYLLVDMDGYSTGSGLRYSMAWVKNVENLDWVEWRNLSSADFSLKFEQYKDDYRMVDVESYRHNGVQYYAGIWVENKNNRGWAEYRDMTETSYRNRWYRLRDQGYRLVDFDIYQTASGERYAGVWRQNGDRLDWGLREQIDVMGEQYLNSNDLPGFGVAIAIGGEIKYMRGFGYQDVNDGVWYSARTINRLASVSKAVAGVLTLRLWQNGVIDDLDASSESLLPALPNHHTHTLRQLLANRSGIGHYEDYDVPEAQYNTALSASQTFWNTDSKPSQSGTQLVYTPGAACKYSTHASTVLGALLEDVLNKNITQIVEEQLSAPFGLATLQVENRSDGDDNRSAVYDKNNSEVSADNTSWKVLGGGLEASPYDLVRFGMKTIDGTIINGDTLDEMLLAPAPVPCTDPDWGNMSNYALGWSAGTQKGTEVAWKGGNQLGSNTTIRIFPDKEMVIVVLANRNENNSTGTFAKDLGDLILDNQAEAGVPADAAADSGYSFGALNHLVLGNLQAFFNRNKQLVLTDFASSDDSIKSKLNGAALWRSTLEFNFDMRTPTPMQATLTAHHQSRQEAAKLNLKATPNGMQIAADFGVNPWQVQYLLDNQIVGKGATGTGQTASVNWNEIWCVMQLPQGLPSEICRIVFSYYGNQEGKREWNLAFAKPMSATLADGTTIQYNRLRLVEVGAGQLAAADVAALALDSMEIQASNLEMLTLQSAESSSQDGLPALPQEGNASSGQKIFLPLVTR